MQPVDCYGRLVSMKAMWQAMNPIDNYTARCAIFAALAAYFKVLSNR